MALVIADGFDLYADITDLVKSGWNPSVTSLPATMELTDGRFGGGCVRLANFGGHLARSVNYAAGSTLIVGFAMFQESGGSATSGRFFSMNISSSGRLMALEVNSAGDLIVRNQAATQVGSTANGVLNEDVWHWVEVKVVFGTNDSNGEIHVNVDGASVVSVTGTDTFNGSSAVRQIVWGTASPSFNRAVRYDDIIIMDGTGGTLNDFLGDTQIETLSPTADGAVQDWSGDFNDINETPNAASDADYVASNTPGDEARFGFGNLSSQPQDIHAVQVRVRAAKSNAGNRTYRGLINSGGTEDLGGTKGVAATPFWDRNGVFDVDPDTSLEWTYAGVNAIEAGVEIVS